MGSIFEKATFLRDDVGVQLKHVMIVSLDGFNYRDRDDDPDRTIIVMSLQDRIIQAVDAEVFKTEEKTHMASKELMLRVANDLYTLLQDN